MLKTNELTTSPSFYKEREEIKLEKCSKCFALTTDLANHECPEFMKLLINRSKKGKNI